MSAGKPAGPLAVCLMGPTAAGKTGQAIALLERFPFEIVSVDSALVYRGMDIGTAKPDAETLERAPHRLVDIRDPEDSYSAGAFVRDAMAAIEDITRAGRIPLLAGGTMMYFRALTDGLAELPSASPEIREAIDRDAQNEGWPALHARLVEIDPDSAARIEPNDRQRIQRALEVYLASGETLSSLRQVSTKPAEGIRFLKLALNPADRAELHRRIEQRLEQMLAAGFVDEVRGLMQRPGLDRDSPAMRAVGYRQYWSYLAGDYDADEAFRRALYATRQLAKRQITWLRKMPDVFVADPLEAGATDAISAQVERALGQERTRSRARKLCPNARDS